MDAGFPHIVYQREHSPLQHGLYHGEEYRQAIAELAGIRRHLMLEKNPSLATHVEDMARKQAEHTRTQTPHLYQELEGIVQGSRCSLSDIIILNNYTDFRDINLVDEGCTTVGMAEDDLVSAQTWDMHGSAKNYLATLELPNGTQLLTLTGCLGMMGANTKGNFIGVNNLNTNDARPGLVWPALVRLSLEQDDMPSMLKTIEHSPVTSGHNYLLSDGQDWYHLERSPQVYGQASHLNLEREGRGVIFHTNHCLTPEAKQVQDTISANSTTHERYALMEQKRPSLKTQADIKQALQSHDGYPKSLCSHFQSGAQDPSITCGGGVYNHRTQDFIAWRGCVHEDDNYQERALKVAL